MMVDKNGNHYCESYLDSVVIGEIVFVLGHKILNDDVQHCEILEESMYPDQMHNISMYIQKFESNNLSDPTATFTMVGDSATVYGRSIVAHPMGGIIICGSIWGSDESVTVMDNPDYSTISDGSGGNNSTDMYVARFDESLNLLWSTRYKFGPNYHDICYSVGTFNEVDEEGSDAVYIYAGGATWVTETNMHIALLAINETGKYAWHKSVGSATLNILPTVLQFSNTDKAFYIAGMQTVRSTGALCAFVRRFDLDDHLWHLVWTMSSCADGILFNSFDDEEALDATFMGLGGMVLGNDGMIYLSGNVMSNEIMYVALESLTSTDGHVSSATHLVGDELVGEPYIRNMKLSAEGAEVLLVGYYSRNGSADKQMVQGVRTANWDLWIKPYVGTTGRLNDIALAKNGTTAILAGSSANIETSTLSTVQISTEAYLSSVELGNELEVLPSVPTLGSSTPTYLLVILILVPTISFVVLVCSLLYCRRVGWWRNRKVNGKGNNGMDWWWNRKVNGKGNNGMGLEKKKSHGQDHCLAKSLSDVPSIHSISNTLSHDFSGSITSTSSTSPRVVLHQKSVSDITINPTVESFEISPNDIELQLSVLLGKGCHGNVHKARYNGQMVAVKCLKPPQNVSLLFLLFCQVPALSFFI